MKRAIALLVVCLLLVGTVLPGPAWAWGSRHGGHFGGHGGWWWPGAVVGGIALGVAAIVTAPFWLLSPVPAYSPPVVYAPPPTYASPPPIYQPAPGYAPPRAPMIRREVVYPNGRYVLYGDGVRQPWQWVWVPSAPPPPPSQHP